MSATRALRLLALSASMILLASGLASCTEVSADTSPNAVPPTFTWQILNQDSGNKEPVPANLQAPAKVDSHYFVTITAYSPSGVKVISAQRGESWYCSNGQGVGSQSTADFPNPDTQTQNAPNTSGQALDTLFLVENVDLSTMPCTEGFSFTSGTYSLAVSASNFANQQTQAFFAFQVTP